MRATLRHPYGVPLSIENAGNLSELSYAWPFELGGPLPAVRLQRADRHELIQKATARRRGAHELSTVWLWLSSKLGLWRRRIVASAPCTVNVWPDVQGPALDSLGSELNDDGARSVQLPAQSGSELRGLKRFALGDDPRHVDWKATARSGHPVIRQWHPDRRRWVVVLIDAGRLMRAEHDGESKFDAAVRALVRVAMAARSRGDRVGVMVFNNRVVRWVPPLDGPVQVDHLVKVLSDLEPSGVESDASCVVPQLLSLSRRALVLWLTDVMDSEGCQKLIQSASRVAARHLPIVALLRDPALDAALQRPIEAPPDAYRRAAAELVARQRETARVELSARNVPALDLSMKSLALTVVQRYIDARWRARW